MSEELIQGKMIRLGDTDLDLGEFCVIDIRDRGYYEEGHYKGALNMQSMTDVFLLAKTSKKPILLTCFTGNTAKKMLTKIYEIIEASEEYKHTPLASMHYLRGDIDRAGELGLLEKGAK